MPAFLMMLAAVAAQPSPTSAENTAQTGAATQISRAAPVRAPNLMRSGEYLAYRLCLQKTASGAYDAGIIPEDLLPELVRACATERDAMVKSASFRAQMRPEADAHDEDALVTNLTSPFVAVAIRNYMYRYATGRRLGQ